MKKLKIGLAAILTASLFLSGCSNEDVSQSQQEVSAQQEASSNAIESNKAVSSEPASADIFAMDTYMSITCYGDQAQDALDSAIEEIQRLDDLLSVGKEDSEISLLNASGHATLSEDTGIMVNEALQITETTNGAFDITVYPLMELWGFTSGDFAVPDEDSLQEVLETVGSDRLEFDEVNSTLSLGESQGIDLGGIAKGYTSDSLMQIFKDYELDSAMVSLGGNVHCYGTKPDGSQWRCGIQDPLNAEDGTALMGIVSISDQAVITSGAYERNFTDEETGAFYHHIIDPSTGYPADNGILSVTIVSENGMLADALSTACYVMGLEESIAYWQAHAESFDFVIMTEDGQVYVTETLEDRFSSDYPMTVIEKEGANER